MKLSTFSLLIWCLSLAYSFKNPIQSSRSLVILYHRSSRNKRSYVYNDRSMTPGGFGKAGDPPFEIRGFSLSNVILGGGFLITASSLVEYITNSISEIYSTNQLSGLSGLGFVYGLPIFLIGAALKYGEITPVPIKATRAANIIFNLKKTETIEKIKKDVTRHRYGDEAHLDTTVKALGLVIPQKSYPQLQYIEYGISENNELEFTMVWQSLDTPFTVWNEETRIEKYDTFFGPGVWSQVIKVSGPDRLVGIKLTTGERPLSETQIPALGVWRMGCENVE